jgi:hypothetical protein
MCASDSSRAEDHAFSRGEGWFGSIAVGYEARSFRFGSDPFQSLKAFFTGPPICSGS